MKIPTPNPQKPNKELKRPITNLSKSQIPLFLQIRKANQSITRKQNPCLPFPLSSPFGPPNSQSTLSSLSLKTTELPTLSASKRKTQLQNHKRARPFSFLKLPTLPNSSKNPNSSQISSFCFKTENPDVKSQGNRTLFFLGWISVISTRNP